ncbi:MAG: DUF6151 family protein [Halofilum sp. (in: g-proteobacteria)]
MPDLRGRRRRSIIRRNTGRGVVKVDALPIRCNCGAVRAHADLRDHHARRAVCYCRDCRMFAHFLDRADTILDPYGGTEVVQLPQGRLRFETGRERLACMRLTRRGLLRWHAACCHTPIGNIPAHRHLPYLGLIHGCIDYRAAGHTPDSALGPIAWRVNAHDLAMPARDIDAHDGIPLRALIPVAVRVLGWSLRGDPRRSPFFEPATGTPIATPRVLSPDEHTALRRALR